MVEAAGQNINTQYLPTSYMDEGGNLTVSPEKALEVSQGIQARAESLPESQRVLFLALVKSPDFAPAASTNVADTSQALDVLEGAANILANATSSDTARLLGRLLVELGAQQRQEALDSRLIARTTARAELEAGADKLRDAADKTLAGAVAALVLSVVSAVVSIVMSAVSIGSAAKGLKNFGDFKTAQKDPGNLDIGKMTKFGDTQMGQNSAAAASKGQAYAGISGAVNGVGQASANSSSSFASAAAQNEQAAQNDLQAEAEVTKSEGDLEATEQQALEEFVRQLIAFIKELRDAEVEQLAVVTRG